MTENTGFFSISSEKPKVKLRAPQYIYVRMLLFYTLLYAVAFFLGCLLFHFLNVKESQMMNAHIIAYFSKSADYTSVFDFAKQTVFFCREDLSHLLLIFIAGFTMLAGLTVSAILIFRGFSLGFSVSYLAYAVRGDMILIDHPTAAVVLYSLLCAFTAAIMLHSAVKAVMFSDDFKALCGRPSRIIRSKALYLHIFRLLIGEGAILILNLIRYIV